VLLFDQRLTANAALFTLDDLESMRDRCRVEQERHASVLAVSTLHFHADKTDPKPILAKSWQPADGKDRCQHARPAVIVLGEGQGRF
jgi:hypothetical protein